VVPFEVNLAVRSTSRNGLPSRGPDRATSNRPHCSTLVEKVVGIEAGVAPAEANASNTIKKELATDEHK
jgi:hypothetical protein